MIEERLNLITTDQRVVAEFQTRQSTILESVEKGNGMIRRDNERGEGWEFVHVFQTFDVIRFIKS